MPTEFRILGPLEAWSGGEREHALALLGDALASYDSIGMPGDAARAAAFRTAVRR